MKTCPCCGGKNLQSRIEGIFDHDHETLDCLDCDCLYVKNIDLGEWIETSSLVTQEEIGKFSGQANIRKHCGGALRVMAS